MSTHSVYSFIARWQCRMTPSGTGVLVEKIDRIYFCIDCKVVYLFGSDALDHERLTGHAEMHEIPFDD